MTKRVIIDVDVGSDDAYALMFLLYEHKRSNIVIEAITCVQGNTNVDNVVINVLRLLEITKLLQIPVYKGPPDAILMNNRYIIPLFHGEDGLGDLEHDSFPNLGLLQNENAVIALNRIISGNPKKIGLICIGPLTNVALALKVFPNFKDQVLELYLMGGNYTGVGNTTASAEFNFHCDPEAASIVLDCIKCPVVMMPIETCQKSKVPLEWRFNVVGKIDNEFIKLMNRVDNKVWGKVHQFWYPCDAYLVAAFLYPDEIILQKTHHNVSVELAGYKTRGQVVLDHLKTLTPNAIIIESLNVENFKRLFIEAAQGLQ